MTIQNCSTSSSEEENISTNISHENEEQCREYMNNTENLIIGNISYEASFKLVNSKSVSKIMSPPLIMRGLPWKLLAVQNYRKGDSKATLCLSVLCDVKTDAMWSCVCDISLALLNFVDETKPVTLETKFVFSWKTPEFKFQEFLSMKDFYRADSQFVDKKHFKIRMSLASTPPKGLIWDSRRITGYVGIINQGATCYLNSLLQTLYFAEPLKRVIFKAQTEIDHRTRSVVLALQYTFMDLLYSDRCVNSKKLTDSFGWSSSEVYVQRDVQEMCRLLIDHIESKIKGSVIEGEIAKLLEGKLIVMIKCLNVDYQSNTPQTFYDIQLNVKNMKNIYEAFDHYCEDELLEGDNKYNAREHGLQDATKYTRFEKFPPLLHLHLLRFVVNFETFNYEKVNDRFEFPKKLILDKYLTDDSTNRNNEYFLQSVLVHCGSSSGGHYMAFVSPKCDDNWYKFDDEIVSMVSENEAIEGNYGSNDSRFSTAPTAYMLMYINSDILNDPSYQFSASDIPEYLRNIYDAENDRITQKLTLENNINNYVPVRFILDDLLHLTPTSQTVDLRLFNNMQFNVPESFTLHDVKWLVCNHMGVDAESIRLWFLKTDQVMPLRPQFIPREVHKHPIAKIVDRYKNPFFIQKIKPEEEEYDRELSLQLFVHNFDQQNQLITYHGFHQINRKHPVNVAFSKLCSKLNIKYTQNTLIFYEKWQFAAEMIKTSDTLVDDVLGFGNDCESIIIQSSYDENVDINDSNHYPFMYAHHFLEDCVHKYSVSFYNILNPDESSPDFTINVSKKMTLQHMMKEAAKYFPIPVENIRIYKTKLFNTIQSHIKTTYTGTLSTLFASLNRSSDKQKLFYMSCKHPAVQHDDQLMYYVSYRLINCEGNISIFLNPDNITQSSVIEAFRQAICPDPSIVEMFRKSLFRIVFIEDYVIKIISGSEDISFYFDEINNTKVRIEQIPPDQLSLQSDDILITVAVKNKESPLIPIERSFIAKLNTNQTYQDVINYFHAKGVRNMTKITVYDMVDKSFVHFPTDLNKKITIKDLNIDILYDEAIGCHVADNASVLIEVIDPSVQQPRSRRIEPAIKIHE